MAIVSGETVRVVCRMQLFGNDDIVNVYHYEHGGGTDVLEDDFMVSVEDAMNIAYALIAEDLTDNQTLTDIKADKVAFSGGELITVAPVGIVAWNGAGQPTNPAEFMPPGVAGIVNFTTGVSGVVGRKYIGIPGEVSVGNGNLSSGFLSGLSDYAAVVLAGFSVGFIPFNFGVMSTRLSAFAGCTDAIIRSQAGYQRRRTIGRGS